MVIYLIYEIDANKYYLGGRSWTYNKDDAMRFKSVGEAQAIMRGLYKQHSGYNLMYKKFYT
jgi:hypothetical protein